MLKLGTVAFGGPAVHVAMLRDEAVRRRSWLDDQEFLDLFGAVSILPGPSSTQLAIALGRRRAGWRGLLIAGTCFIAPAMAIVVALAWAYTRYGTTPTGGGVLYGVEPVVVAIVAVALWELGRKAVARPQLALIAAMAVAAYVAGLNVLVPLLAGGVIASAVANRRSLPALVPVVPLLRVGRIHPGTLDVLGEFLKLGVVVFGSGYVLLAFLRADLVSQLHWLTERQVLDAVAAGQITPGPVFTTATFVGYQLGGLPLALAATAGIFAPSFLLVAALEPFVTRIRRSRWLGPALDGVTVAALGLMAAVTVDLGRSAVRDVPTAALAIGALVLLVRRRTNAMLLMAGGAAVGILHALF